MTLTTTDTQHHALWTALNAARDGTTSVKVDKAALKAILDDHGALVGRLGPIVPITTTP